MTSLDPVASRSCIITTTVSGLTDKISRSPQLITVGALSLAAMTHNS